MNDLVDKLWDRLDGESRQILADICDPCIPFETAVSQAARMSLLCEQHRRNADLRRPEDKQAT